MKNIQFFFSKPIKHSKNADPLLFLLSFTKCQREKNIEKTLFGSAGTQKVDNQWVLGLLGHNIY